MSTVINAAAVKAHLVGVQNWLGVAAQSPAGAGGALYDDSYISEVAAQVALRSLEDELEYRIERTQISSMPDGLYAPVPANGEGIYGGVVDALVDGTPTILEGPYDYYAEDWEGYASVILNYRPVLKLQRIRLMFDSNTPVWEVPDIWNSLNRGGIASVVPFKTAGPYGAAQVTFALVQAALGQNGYVPNFVSVDYVVGLQADWQSHREYLHLQRAIEERTAMQVLEDINQAYYAGLLSASMSAMGFSQQFPLDRFEKRIAQLQASVAAFKDKYIDAASTGGVVYSL